MPYRIKKYTYTQAKRLGVTVKPSQNPKKKIDVFKKTKDKNGKMVMKKVASVGSIEYNDFPTFMALERQGKVKPGTAAKRRKAYKARHSKNRNKVGTPSYYADKLLW